MGECISNRAQSRWGGRKWVKNVVLFKKWSAHRNKTVMELIHLLRVRT